MAIDIKLVVPVWLLVCALVVVFTAPSGMAATGLLLLISALAAAAILFIGKNPVQPPVFAGAPTIDVRPLSVEAVAPINEALLRQEPSALRPLSWPDSGFRNIGRGTKGG